jgi:hypothetical protein
MAADLRERERDRPGLPRRYQIASNNIEAAACCRCRIGFTATLTRAYTEGMCAACAMAAAAGATGARTWLQTRGWTWLTPTRLKRATIGAFVAAAIISSVGLSGSTQPTSSHHTPVAATAHK